MSVRRFAFLMLALQAQPGLAEPSTFNTTIGPAVLCLSEVDPDYFHTYLNTHFGQASKRQGAWWWQAAGRLYGAQVSEVFVTDTRGRFAGIGALSSFAGDKLAEHLNQMAAGTFVKQADGSWHSNLGSVIVDLSGSAKIYCLRAHARYLAR